MNQAITIKRGTFKLAHDLDNPKPSKRGSHWHHAASWKQGTKFIIEDFTLAGETVASIRTQDARFDCIAQGHPAFWAILECLEPCEEEPTDMLARVNWSRHAGDVLDQLFREGKFTLADAEAALETVKREQYGEDP